MPENTPGRPAEPAEDAADEVWEEYWDRVFRWSSANETWILSEPTLIKKGEAAYLGRGCNVVAW